MSHKKNGIMLLQLDNLLCEYEYFKRKTGLNAFEPILCKKNILQHFIHKFNIPIRSIYTIVSFLQGQLVLKKDNNDLLKKLLISKIITEPHNFITEEQSFIPFEIYENICAHLNIQVSSECWANNYFLNTKKSFFVSTKTLREDHRSYFKKSTQDKNFNDIFIEHSKSISTRKCYLNIEKEVTRMVKNIFEEEEDEENDNKQEDVCDFIVGYEKEKLIKLNTLQKEAIINCVLKRSHVVCGFPGTGKTTIVDVLKEFMYYKNPDCKISLMAPTGLAIKNLMRKCIVNTPDICGTIHRMVYNIFNYVLTDEESELLNMETFSGSNLAEDLVGDLSSKDLSSNDMYTRFVNKKKLKLSKLAQKMIPEVIVVDEFSMVDMLLLKDLLICCELFNCKLILTGDEHQLPPIGPGNALHEITHYTKFQKHVTFLTDIMRQDNQLLVDNIKRIKNDEFLMEKEHFDNETMFLLNYVDFIDAVTKDVSKEKLVLFIEKHDIKLNTSQFLTPENNKNCGNKLLNTVLQDHYNPKKSTNGIPGSSFRLHDNLVRKQNCVIEDQGSSPLEQKPSTSSNIFANGDVCQIIEVNKKNKENISVTVKYDDGALQDMSVSDLNDDFALRYSLTIHKSQGGEYDDIILFMGTPHENSSWKQPNSKKLFYTAVSRAKKRCFIIAKKNLIMIAQSIDEEIPITTFLK